MRFSFVLFWCWSFGLITHRSVYFILFFYIYFYISRGKHTTTKPFLSFSDILKYIKLEDIYIISFFYFLFLFFFRARFDDILLLLKYHSCIVLFSFCVWLFCFKIDRPVEIIWYSIEEYFPCLSLSVSTFFGPSILFNMFFWGEIVVSFYSFLNFVNFPFSFLSYLKPLNDDFKRYCIFFIKKLEKL